jgi:site-specific DNA-adenine methylase
MRIRPFFYFYGSKWSKVGLYPSPRHEFIVEPFCGGAGYSLNYPQRQVWINDADPVIFGVWDYLTKVSQAEILRLPLVFETTDDLDLPQEARWLIGFWLNKGTSAPRKSPSKWMRDGGRPNTFWGSSARQRIASQLPAIKHWRVTNLPYEDVCYHRDATWFVDPPYQQGGEHYRFSVDHSALGAHCLALAGQVIVCERAGADWLPFSFLYDQKTSNGGEGNAGQRIREALWTNDPVESQMSLAI